MSSTRHAPHGSTVSYERYMSSPEYAQLRGIPGTAVATKAQLYPEARKRSLLFFWAAWLTVVFTTNLLDGAKAVGLLEEGWEFASGNYRFLTQTTTRYGTPGWANGLLKFLYSVTSSAPYRSAR